MGYKILLVEDNPHIMEINTEALEMEDYEVFQAADGKSCMELLKSKEPDMVVLDIMLPDTDGLKLCREIKAKADIPILFLSALSENRQIV
ncbi:MAG: response regulator, partial [Lachnospiraceae bacterium]|nr:response regulator [Lachnospiraceae bacterium]